MLGGGQAFNDWHRSRPEAVASSVGCIARRASPAAWATQPRRPSDPLRGEAARILPRPCLCLPRPIIASTGKAGTMHRDTSADREKPWGIFQRPVCAIGTTRPEGFSTQRQRPSAREIRAATLLSQKAPVTLRANSARCAGKRARSSQSLESRTTPNAKADLAAYRPRAQTSFSLQSAIRQSLCRWGMTYSEK